MVTGILIISFNLAVEKVAIKSCIQPAYDNTLSNAVMRQVSQQAEKQ